MLRVPKDRKGCLLSVHREGASRRSKRGIHESCPSKAAPVRVSKRRNIHRNTRHPFAPLEEFGCDVRAEGVNKGGKWVSAPVPC